MENIYDLCGSPISLNSADMVLAVLKKQQQLADNPCQLSEEASRNVAVDVYLAVTGSSRYIHHFKN
jgi:hypothetical protein